MATAAGPKPIGLRLEPGFPLRFQRVERPRLARAINDNGNPSGRRLVLLPLFGMYTRLTGRALNGSAIWCTLSASVALACGVSTTSPSTPAVKRPALRSVTRRTLKSVFARERSINFCKLRTFFRSPAFDAVKIRCRNRRTSSSTRRQSTACQSKGASSGPFTATVVAASNLSSGSGASIIFLSTGSPDRVSALPRPGTRPGIRPVIRNDRLEEAAIVSRFPAAFRLPAAEVGQRRGGGYAPFPLAPSRTRREPFSSPGSPATIPCLTRSASGVDAVVAGFADHEGLASSPRHDLHPFGLVWLSGLVEI